MYQSLAQDPTGHFYAVLNVPRDASQAEINERHRALSLIFHPDKLHGEPRDVKEVATEEFLEVQKAYQVLSDPFLRQVYDTLGLEGLALRWPADIRSKSKEEIHEALESANIDESRRKLREAISPKSQLTLSVDASPLFTSDETNVLSNIKRLKFIPEKFTYSTEKELDEKTTLSLKVKSLNNRTKGSLHFLGTVRHQFSPRLAAWASLNVSRPYNTKFGLDYEDDDNSIRFKAGFLPFSAATNMAETSFSISRRLWRRQPQRGKVTIKFGGQPSASFMFISPSPLNVVNEESTSPKLLPTISGLKQMVFSKRFGIIITNYLPTIFVEATLMLVQLSTTLTSSLHYDLIVGLTYTLGCHWSSETSQVDTALILNMSGISLQLNLSYLEQRIALPIVLSTEYSPILALATIIIPSTVAVFGYHFVVVPRRRNRWNKYLRKTFEEDSDVRRKRDKLQSLLKGVAKKQVNIETKRDGLIIENATYGASEIDGDTSDFLVDVTIPLQALVTNSQLHIAGGHTKAALQGFSDPAPFAPKSLRIRYLFRCRVHYAEIPDCLPTVLPLAEHQVDAERA